MTVVAATVFEWQPPPVQSEYHGTLMLPEGARFEILADPTDYVSVIEAQQREYRDEFLGEALNQIRRQARLEVDGETQRLLDAAVDCRSPQPSGGVEEWAARLADDVKDAND